MNARFLAPLLFSVLLPACTRSDNSSAPATPVAGAATAAADAQLCALEPGGAWSACVGKPVEIRGQQPRLLTQHPMLAAPALPGTAAQTQTYVETPEGLQVIVLTTDGQGPCAGPMRVRGTLQEVELGGAEGTPSSYRGWAVQGANIACE